MKRRKAFRHVSGAALERLSRRHLLAGLGGASLLMAGQSAGAFLILRSQTVVDTRWGLDAAAARNTFPEVATDVSLDAHASLGRYRRTVNVAGSGQLTRALADAREGDDIVLANDTYIGTFTLNKSGKPEHPIRLRAATHHGANLAAKLTLHGSHIIVLQGVVPGKAGRPR